MSLPMWITTVFGGTGAFFSNIIGWIYFVAWSVSFYPQVILNWRRKSVQGLSIDFLWYNVYGFVCYSIFNIAFFASEEIRRQYRRRHDNNDNLVRVNDLLFSLHALTLTFITLYQSFIYYRDPSQRLSSVAFTLIVATLLIAFALTVSVLMGLREWIDLLYYLSYVKLALSFIKYCPQALLNYKRKSTVGWSIENILLDFIGGMLSVGQLILDAYLTNDWTGITGDLLKFGLGLLSVSFDVLFIIQHYVLYRDRNEYIVLDDDCGFENSSSSSSAHGRLKSRKTVCDKVTNGSSTHLNRRSSGGYNAA